MKKGKEKRRKITLKKGEKALKFIFLGYKLNPARRKLICRGKKFNLKRGGGGNIQNAQYISLRLVYYARQNILR